MHYSQGKFKKLVNIKFNFYYYKPINMNQYTIIFMDI